METVFKRFVDLQAVWSERLAGMIERAKEEASGALDEDDEEELSDDDDRNADFIITP